MHGGEAIPSNATTIVESGLDSKTDEMLMGHLAMFQQDEEELVRFHSLLHQRAKVSLNMRLQARRVLRNTSIFAKWDAADVEAVVKRMDTRTFLPGTRICSQGDPHADEFYIIMRGNVRVHQRRPKGVEKCDDFSLPLHDSEYVGGERGESKVGMVDDEMEIRVLRVRKFWTSGSDMWPLWLTRTASCSAVAWWRRGAVPVQFPRRTCESGGQKSNCEDGSDRGERW